MNGMSSVLYSAYILERSQVPEVFTVNAFRVFHDSVVLDTAEGAHVTVSGPTDPNHLRRIFRDAGILLQLSDLGSPLRELEEATPWERWLELQMDLSQSEVYVRDFGFEYRVIRRAGMTAKISVKKGSLLAEGALDLSSGPIERGLAMDLVDEVLRDSAWRQ
jgi:hypothetical protein